ncbi:MAG TPA: hypothetical protein PKZ14_08325, partial [Chitinophagales bacterium]|nr:hypothetical protein [Chitinophagales bacterium]
MEHEDKILSTLSTAIINRKLFKIEYADEILVNTKFNALKNKYNEEEMRFLVLKGTAKNNAYNPDKDNIFIKFKDGSIK